MLTLAWTQLRYHRAQSELWRCPARFVAVAAGRGSGKTELARRRIARFLAIRKPWPDPMYFYALPTVNQAKRVAWKPLLKLIPAEWISKINHSDMVIETVYGSSLYVLGMDKPERAEGVQWDGGIIDESCDQKPSVFDLNLLPALSWRNGWCWRIGVPKRYGIGAENFKAFFERGLKYSSDVQSFTWMSEEILTPDQLAWAREHLDARDFNEQYRATWERAGGTIFYAFLQADHVTDEVTYEPQMPLVIGSDFNVDPMCWVIGHIKGQELHVWDELFVRNTNTAETLNILYTKYGTHRGGFEFYGDASSRARKTSAAQSDYVQIRSDLRFTGARVFYPQSNPAVVDRFAACNAMFCSASGVRRLFIHPRCVHLIRDLKAREWKQGSREPDDYGDVGHMTDALGYVVHRRFPIKLPPPSVAAGVSLGG
jgi:hypothetical protein